MRLSTSINLMDPVLGEYGKISAEECMVRCRMAGFRVMDFNFFDQERVGMPMNLDNWDSWLSDIKKLSRQLGLEFSQTHPNFFNMFDQTNQNISWEEEKIRRGIIGSGILEAKWAVFHVGTIFKSDGSPDDKASLKANMEYLRPLLKLAHEHHTGIAVENLGRDSFARTAENLISLVDEMGDEALGICWDFGHANMMGLDQAESLQKIGKRLKATHIADNHGIMDEHLPPFFGSINWKEMVHTLKEIGYQGDFTYEIQNVTRNLPNEHRDTFLRYLVELGEYTLKL